MESPAPTERKCTGDSCMMLLLLFLLLLLNATVSAAAADDDDDDGGGDVRSNCNSNNVDDNGHGPQLSIQLTHVQQLPVAASTQDDPGVVSADHVYDCDCSLAMLHPDTLDQCAGGGNAVAPDCSPDISPLFGVMATLRVFVVARVSSSFTATTDVNTTAAAGGSSAVGSSSAHTTSAAAARSSSSSGLKRVCDGLMHMLQPLTSLLVEVIPLSMPVEVLDHQSFLAQAKLLWLN